MQSPTKTHSRYWIGKNRFDSIYDSRNDSLDDVERALRLRDIRNGIANFVRILTGQSIPVVFKGTESYTDGKVVVISTSDDPAHIDSMVGLACHEGTHIVRSQHILYMFRELGAMHDRIKNVTASPTHTLALNDLLHRGFINSRLRDAISNAVTRLHPAELSQETIFKSIQLMMNFLEDRRIDNWQYNQAPGYRPYYDACYERFFLHPSLADAIQDEENRTKSIPSYFFHILNMMHEKFDPDALPGLREIVDLFDISNIIRLDGEDDKWREAMKQFTTLRELKTDIPEFLNVVWEALAIIYDNIDLHDPLPVQMVGKGENIVEEILGQQILVVMGEIAKEANSNAYIQIVQESNSEIRKISIEHNGEFIGKENVVVHRNPNTAALTGLGYLAATPDYYANQGVQEGIQLGNRVLHMIRTFNDVSIDKVTHQEHGRLDKKLVHQLGYNTENIFSVSRTVRTKPVLVDMSIDASGSMTREKWLAAIKLAVAYAMAAHKLKNFNVRISLRSSPNSLATVAIVYDSRIHHFQRIKTLFPRLVATGGTPEGLCFSAIQKELLEEVRGTNRFFVNISDGMPEHHMSDNRGFYSGELAYHHTRSQINLLRKNNIRIMSYYVSNSAVSESTKEAFRTMYGEAAAFIDPQSTMQVARTLNKLFLDKGEV